MKKYVKFVFCVLLASAAASPPSVSKQYRTDYEYNHKTDAFYKLHIVSRRFWLATAKCKAEGAELMVPSSDYDIKQLHIMFKKFPDLGEYVLVGNDGHTHESAEERPIIDLSKMDKGSYCSYCECDVLTRQGEIESLSCFNELPFICKVSAKDAPYTSECDVYGKDYRYYPSVGSCYKIPRTALTWSQAYAECQAEGAHLVVLNSQAEHDAVYNLTNTEPRVIDSKAEYFFFAGFRAEEPIGNATAVFKTIFNQTLEEAGYSEWAPNEPNNALKREYCGSIFRNDGKLNDLDCSNYFGYICEKEVLHRF